MLSLQPHEPVPVSEPLRLSGLRIFLTGGTGFVGRSILDYCAEAAARHEAEFSVTVPSRAPDAFLAAYSGYANLPWLHLVPGDLAALPDIGRYDALIHAAADTHRADDPIGWFNQLVSGTRQVLDHAVRAGAVRALLVSSGAVYGGGGNRPVETDDTFAPQLRDPDSVYAQGKRAAEHLFALYGRQHGIEGVVARLFAVISPHMPLDGPYAAGNFIRDVLADNQPAIRVAGNPATLRSYIDGRDMAHWLVTLLLRGTAGEAYNVGSDQAITIPDLARVIGAALGIDKPVALDPTGTGRPASVYVPAIAKAAGLDLAIETSLSEAIVRAAAGHRRQDATSGRAPQWMIGIG
jgi:nucleoside-diphosphate-sugar epimerase